MISNLRLKMWILIFDLATEDKDVDNDFYALKQLHVVDTFTTMLYLGDLLTILSLFSSFE